MPSDDEKDEIAPSKLLNKKRRIDKVATTQRAHSLAFRNLVRGMSVVGAVKEIDDLELTVSLPSGLSGCVSITDISDELCALLERIANDDDDAPSADSVPDLRSLFHVGQLVLCTVLDFCSEDGSKRRIDLSLNPRHLYSSLCPSKLVSGMVSFNMTYVLYIYI